MDYSFEAVATLLDSLFADLRQAEGRIGVDYSPSTDQGANLGKLISDVQDLQAELAQLKIKATSENQARFFSYFLTPGNIPSDLQVKLNLIGESAVKKIEEFNALGTPYQHAIPSVEALTNPQSAPFAFLDKLSTTAKWIAIGLAVGAALYVAVNIKTVVKAVRPA